MKAKSSHIPNFPAMQPSRRKPALMTLALAAAILGVSACSDSDENRDNHNNNDSHDTNQPGNHGNNGNHMK